MLVMASTKVSIGDWWKPEYFYNQIFGGSWGKLEAKAQQGDLKSRLEILSNVQELANNILRSKRYYLFVDYYRWFVASGVTDSGIKSSFYPLLIALYRKICEPKHKLLIGMRNNVPLWVDAPEWAWQDSKIDNDVPSSNVINNEIMMFWFWVVPTVINLMPLFTGQGQQAAFDRLIFPSPDKVNKGLLAKGSIIHFNNMLSEMLGFYEPPENDEVFQILADAILNQRYKLIDGRPVLIRMENNPVVKEVVLMLKFEILIAKIDTVRFGEIVHIFGIADPMLNEGSLGAFAANVGIEEGVLQGLSALVATLYRDLVTVENVTATRKLGKATKVSDDKVTPADKDKGKPKLYTTSWQLIPRRQYTNQVNSDVLVERDSLTDKETDFRIALRRYHMVCGFIRHYRNKPDFMAKGEKQDEALADGIILRQGETYVKPHARGLSALDGLGEIDISSVPHYLRRGRKE